MVCGARPDDTAVLPAWQVRITDSAEIEDKTRIGTALMGYLPKTHLYGLTSLPGSITMDDARGACTATASISHVMYLKNDVTQQSRLTVRAVFVSASVQLLIESRKANV